MTVESSKPQELSGSKVVETKAGQTEIVEPWRAGEYDPPMQDWLRLPIADSCPADPELHREWGTRNPRGYFHVRVCRRCGTEFRAEATASMVAEIAEALSGTPRRFVLR